ncbi:MAG: hypothetical protein H6R48_1067, partial [Proteobacteria bacterium]|nr:hypothetical protein [Pseudomonadota bacterium]
MTDEYTISMNILEYRDLDLAGLRKPYQKVA